MKLALLLDLFLDIREEAFSGILNVGIRSRDGCELERENRAGNWCALQNGTSLPDNSTENLTETCRKGLTIIPNGARYRNRGVTYIIGSVAAQQYSSAAQRQTSYESNAPVAPVRTRTRQRQRVLPQDQPTIASRTATEAPQPVRQRGRAVVRARNLVQEDAARARISTGSTEDVYTRPRAQAVQAAPAPTRPPQQQTTRLVTPKPVVEEEEEDGDYISEEITDEGSPEAPPTNTISRSAYVGPYQALPPGLQQQRPLGPIQSQQIQPAYTRPPFLQPTAFRPSQPLSPQQVAQPQPLPNSQSLGVVKQAPRPLPIPQLRPVPSIPAVRPQPPSNHVSEEEEEDEEPQYVRQPPSRQQAKRPQSSEVDGYRQQSKPQPQRQQLINRNQETSRPYPSKASSPPKERKPVSQTVRKHHTENEDGSITWGYENDDGTFKEETIGVDCVTRGKYGYVDPDGVKREYTYQTGIPCDRSAEAEQAASNNEGYIDYTNNKYIFPNGDEIDLDEMVKNRARKPSRYQ